MNDQTTTAAPMSDEELAAIQQRTDAYGRTGPYGYVINDIEYQGNWVHDIHRLLAEADRLRAENADLTAERDRARRIASQTINNLEQLNAEVEREREANALLVQGTALAVEARDALAAKLDATPETTRPPAQPGRGGPETPEGSTDRGTGDPIPQNSIQADDDLNSRHWLKWDTIARIITGCQCGFRADIDSDCGFGDSVVRHLLEVGAEAAVPDVDGWTLRAHPAGFMLSHETDLETPLHDGVHHYLSTGCLHGDQVLPDGSTGHDYCKGMTGMNGAKRGSRCKFCDAKCRCGCHQDQGSYRG